MRALAIVATTILIATACAAAQSADPAGRSADRATRSIDPTALAERSQALVNEAVVRGDAEGLREAAALAERGLAVHPGDPWLLHYHGYALYRLAARRGCDEEEDRRCVGRLLDRAEASLEASLDAHPIAETYAVLGSVYGLMIGENPASGAALGDRIDGMQRRALELGPDNPRVWLLKGIGDFHTPAAYGGGMDAAARSLERAALAFGSDAPEPPAPRWGRADVHVWLGQVDRALGDVEAARARYHRALGIEPDYSWVREDLLPALGEADG